MIHRIDDFFDDPWKVREEAIMASYEDVKYTSDTYKVNVRGVAKCEAGDLVKIAHTIGPVREALCFYRRYLECEESETYIHSDYGISDWTGIAFLNTADQCRGGTALWKHKDYRWDQTPTKEMLGSKNPTQVLKALEVDGFNQDKWEMMDFAEMRFNRLILFPSPLFHSRFPMKSFGVNVETSRLIKVYFLKV